jgi:hypothetical protein
MKTKADNVKKEAEKSAWDAVQDTYDAARASAWDAVYQNEENPET